MPDILGCYEGSFIAVELKVGTHPTTPLQRLEIDLLNRSGGVACVVRFNKTYFVTRNDITTEFKTLKETIEWILKQHRLPTKKNATTE